MRVSIVLAATAAAIAGSVAWSQTSSAHTEPTIRFLDIPARLYTEPATRSDVTPEWMAFRNLVSWGLAEEEHPGLGVGLAAERFGITEPEAASLLHAALEVRAEMNDSGPMKEKICGAAISSAEDYVEWWAEFEEEIEAHRSAMVDALVSMLAPGVWQPVIEWHFLHWMELGETVIGGQINHQKQVEVADYRVYMRQLCQ
jgi:hypothetical protein